MAEKVCKLAVVGIGTVGGEVVKGIIRDADMIAEKTGVRLVVSHVVDKNEKRAAELGLQSLLRPSLETAVADPEVQIVVELVGGTTFAKTVIETATKAGKAVVTANKALLALHGPELLALARKHGTSISFEASCEGGVPIIRALTDGVVTNRIDALYGIVNGTCNYILTAMTKKGKSYDEALSEAKLAGLAEADPSLDVRGIDSAHKLTILASLAFGRRVDFSSIQAEGIDALDVKDVMFGKELGYIIKLLAFAERTSQGISLKVRPSFIAEKHPLAWVSGSFNAVSVYGHTSGHTMYYGRGAGGNPTSSAVLSDIISSALGTAKILFDSLRIFQDLTEKADIADPNDTVSRFYIRAVVLDKPGVFAKIGAILGKYEISISSVLQKEPSEDEKDALAVPVVITTHQALEGNVRKAVHEIDNLPESAGKSVLISIMDEYEEYA